MKQLLFLKLNKKNSWTLGILLFLSLICVIIIDFLPEYRIVVPWQQYIVDGINNFLYRMSFAIIGGLTIYTITSSVPYYRRRISYARRVYEKYTELEAEIIKFSNEMKIDKKTSFLQLDYTNTKNQHPNLQQDMEHTKIQIEKICNDIMASFPHVLTSEEENLLARISNSIGFAVDSMYNDMRTFTEWCKYMNQISEDKECLVKISIRFL